MKKIRVEWLLLIVLTLALGSIKCLQHYSFKTHSYDTGIYSNVAWNLSRGAGFYNAIRRQNQLGIHFSPIVAVFAPFYKIHPNPCIILAGQAFAVALALVFLFQIARHLTEPLAPRERDWFAWTMLGLAFFYLPVQSALLFEFHPSTLGMPMVAGAILCLHRRKWVLFWVAFLALFTTKELAIITTLGLALYAGVVLRQWRMMLAIVIVGLGLGGVIFKWVMPLFRTRGDWDYYSRWGIWALPWEKLGYLLRLVGYLGLLPLLAPAALLAALPTTLVNLAVNERSQVSLLNHYDDQNSIFLLVAAMHGLLAIYAWMQGRPSSNRVWRMAGLGAVALLLYFVLEYVNQRSRNVIQSNVFLLVAAMYCALALYAWAQARPAGLNHWLKAGGVATLLLLGTAMDGGGIRLLKEIKNSWPRENIRRLHRRLDRYRSLPPEVEIITHNGMLPHFCHRPNFTHLDWGYLKRKHFTSGGYIILAEKVNHYQLDFPETIRALNANPSFKLVEKNKDLIVYRIE